MATTTGEVEDPSRTSTKVTSPANSISNLASPVVVAPSLPPMATTTGEIISPTHSDSPLNIMTDDSSKYDSDSDWTNNSEEDMNKYGQQYEEEDNNLRFFQDLATHTTIDGLERIVFSTADLQDLKEKEKILRDKEDRKYFRSKTLDKTLYDQITAAMAPYLTGEKLKMLLHS